MGPDSPAGLATPLSDGFTKDSPWLRAEGLLPPAPCMHFHTWCYFRETPALHSGTGTHLLRKCAMWQAPAGRGHQLEAGGPPYP